MSIITKRPTKAELKENRPDFWLMTDKPWNKKSEVGNLLQWLIWNINPFDVKERTRYLLTHYGPAAALKELSEVLDRQDHRIYFDDYIFMVWKNMENRPRFKV